MALTIGNNKFSNKWLVSDEEFNDLDDYTELLLENGIVSNGFAYYSCLYSTTMFDIPDCPFCGFNDNCQYKLKNGVYKCKNCRNKYSLTTGRYIENTKIPIAYWWRFTWLISERGRINNCEIARDLGVTVLTAFKMTARLRAAYLSNGIEIKRNIIKESQNDLIKYLMKLTIKQ